MKNKRKPSKLDLEKALRKNLKKRKILQKKICERVTLHCDRPPLCSGGQTIPAKQNIMHITDAFELPHGIGLKHTIRVWGEPGTMPEKEETFDWFSTTDPDFPRAKQELELFLAAKAAEA